MSAPIGPILPPVQLGQLRTALACYTVDSVRDALGMVGQAAHARGDLAGVGRAIREHGGGVRGGEPVRTLIALFLLGAAVPAEAARRAFAPLSLADARTAGLIGMSADEVRAAVEIRPYAETVPSLPTDPAGQETWWVVSDLGSDVRPGPLAADHVLGIGSASLTLAQSTPRTPVASALDVGTGCGIQALHLTRHCPRVTATDLSDRALRFAATTAALSGQEWDLRAGSLFEPARDDRYDLIVANPPFVVSDGGGGYDYRDSGRSGDDVCRTLVRELPQHLTAGGVGQLLANWIVPADGAWEQRVGGWLSGGGCDAWVWQREIAEPGEYVALWLRDAGESPGTPRWMARYNAWLDWFAAAGVVAVGMGMITMWRSEADNPIVVLEDVPQPLAQPVGEHVAGWIGRQRWLSATDDRHLTGERLRVAPGVQRRRVDTHEGQEWRTAAERLHQTRGLRWELDVDEAIAAVVGACDGSVPLGVPLRMIAASLGVAEAAVLEAATPVVRDLVSRGFLLPETTS